MVRTIRSWIPRRVAAALILSMAAGFLAIPASEAVAEEKTFLADKSSWFWSSNSRVTICTRKRLGQDGVCQRATPTEVVNPVSAGHIAVSMKDGSSDMRAYVHFDTSTIPSGSTITRYVAVFKLSRPEDVDHTARHRSLNERPPATVNESAAAIQACAVTEFFAAGSEGDPPYSTKVTPGAPETPSTEDDETEIINTRNEPTFDCGLSAEGKPNEDRTEWRFDITNIAQKWASLERFDEGIALIPLDKGVKPTWTVEFHGMPYIKAEGDEEVVVVSNKEAARAIVEYAPGFLEPLPLPPPPIDTGGFTGGGVTVPPVTTGGEVTTPPPPPAVTPPAPTVGAPVAAIVGATPWWFFLVLVLGLIGVAAMSHLLGGDPLTATNGLTAASRVASVLRGRRMTGAETPDAIQVIEEEELSQE